MASGGSVIAIQYDGGVLMAADTLLSFGSLAKWPNIPRIKLIGEYSAISATGDYADFQAMTQILENQVHRHSIYSNLDAFNPDEIFCHLHRHIYHKRSNFEPCLCQFVFIGYRNGQPFLGAIDDVGTKWTDQCVASGYGEYMALPLLRQALEAHPQGLKREEAYTVMRDCLRVLFYRECKAINRFQIAEATNEGVKISEPFEVDTKWDFEGFSFEKTAIIR